MSTVGPWRPDSAGDSSGSRRRRIFRRNPSNRSDTTLESPMIRNRLAVRVRFAEGMVILMVTLLLFGFCGEKPVGEVIADKSRSRKGESSGLGLAICDRILEGHGSALEIESRVDEGTTVRFLLPAAQERMELEAEG